MAWFLTICHILVFLRSILAVDPGELSIAYNRQAVRSDSSKLLFGSIVQAANIHAISDGNIVHLAIQAYRAMANEAWLAYNVDLNQEQARNRSQPVPWPRSRPMVMTVLVVDNTAYIASSNRGGSFFYDGAGDPKTQTPGSVLALIQDELARCSLYRFSDQPEGTSPRGHKSQASCGEFMALLAWVQHNGDTTSPVGTPMVMVSVWKERGSERIVIAPPCSVWRQEGNGLIACSDFVSSPLWGGNLKIISPDTAEAAFELIKPISNVVLSFA